MMAELILRFHDESLDAFDWLVWQEGVSSQAFQWRSNSESNLGELISSHDRPVILVVPQQCVLMTHFNLPGKASRQILSSIEFQIEDQLGEDIEQQHFATGDITDNSVPIVVIKKSIMQRCQVVQKQYGMTLSKIIPELFLCPWSGSEGEVSVIESQDNVILRFGYYQGFKCQPVLLKVMLDQLNRSLIVKQVTYCSVDSDTYNAMKVDDYDSQSTDLALNYLNDSNVASFDLRQREFKRSSVWGGVLGTWKRVAMILVGFLVVFTSNKFYQQHDLETQLADIQHRQYQLVKSHLPADTMQSDDLKSKFVQLLKQNKASVGNSGLLSRLSLFTEAKQKYASIIISKIDFQKMSLSININSTKLNDVEALVETLEALPLTVKLENLTIKPELISGHLVLGDQ